MKHLDNLLIATRLVALLITLPFLILEILLKCILYILYYPTIVALAIVFPLIKNKRLLWLESWYKYATKWNKNFKTWKIYKLWI